MTWSLPQLGEAVAEGTIDRWLKKAGEPVKKFEPVVEVMTDKVTTEITAPVTGTLQTILVPDGGTAKVGEPIAVFLEEGEAAGKAAPAPEASPPEPAGLFPSSPIGAPAPRAAAANGAFSPAVRRLAAEYGLDPGEIAGTGAGGRVTRDDVLAHANKRRLAGQAPATPGAPSTRAAAGGPSAATPGAPQAAPAAQVPGPRASGDEVVAPSALRRAIAARMVESTRNIPHAWMMVEADVTGLVRLRQSIKADFARREGFDLTYFSFFVKAVVEGLREQPTLNASWTEAGIVYHGRINLGVAVAAEEGLVVPVLHSADGMSVAGIARAVRDLANRARAGDLGPADMQDGTFTVNNTGALGSIVSMPIINPPQSGIITLETIQARPAVVGEGIAIRQIVNLSFSFDHRIADGLTAGRFMQTVKRVMEAYAPGYPVY